MCVKYYELRYTCFKKLHPVKVGVFVLDTASKFALFSESGLKDEKHIYTKTETCKLYSRVF